MHYILNIETSGNACSVALSGNNKLIAFKENNAGKLHASLLSPFIDDVLREGNISPRALSAIAVSKGPGSYTGLRIGVSTAKGLAYALNIPIIGINTLESLTYGFLNKYRKYSGKKDIILCPMIDARRMEVYTCLFSPELKIIKDITAEIIREDSFDTFLREKTIVFFGEGALKCKPVINHENAIFIDFTNLSARFMVDLSIKACNLGNFENTAYFEPFYLKDFIAGKPGRDILRKEK